MAHEGAEQTPDRRQCGTSSDPGAALDGPAGPTPTLLGRPLAPGSGTPSEGGRVRPLGSGVRRQLGPRAQPRALEEPSRASWSWRTVGVLDGQPDLPNSPPAARPPGRPPWTWRGCASTSLGGGLLIRPSISSMDHLGEPASSAGDARSQQGDPWAGPDTGARSGTGLPAACAHLRLPGRGPGLGAQCLPQDEQSFRPRTT